MVELLELALVKGETGADGIFFLNCCFSLVNMNWLGEKMFVFVNDSALALIGHNNDTEKKNRERERGIQGNNFFSLYCLLYQEVL